MNEHVSAPNRAGIRRRAPAEANVKLWLVVVLATFATLITVPGLARAGSITVNACGSFGAGAFSSSSAAGLGISDKCPGGALGIAPTGTTKAGNRAIWQATAPRGITINHFWVGNGSLEVNGINDGTGYGGGFFWQGGGAQVNNSQTGYSSPALSSGTVGWQMVCGWSSCPNNGGFLRVYQVQLQATENSGPGIVATVPFWYTTGWIRGTWPLAFVTSDPSGICNVRAVVAGQIVQGPTSSLDQTQWHQCPDLAFSQHVNTAGYPNGAQQVALQAENAAGVWTTASQTRQIDNVTPTVSLTGPDQASWIPHGVSLSATASAGSSGVSEISCTVDGRAQVWPSASAEVSVDGTGVHQVVCTSANSARDLTGQLASSQPAVRSVKIDETPPGTVAFERQNPADPQQLIVDAADGQSGVKFGTVQIRAVGGQWQPLPTQFDGKHLLARFSDAGLRGDYQFQATACDAVGNCTTTTETMALPLRIPSVSDVSFTQLQTPTVCRSVRQRVLVGWRWVSLRVNGRLVLVKRGGRVRTITVTRCRKKCTSKRVVVRGRSHVVSTCAEPKIVVRSSLRVPFGRAVPIHGLLMTAQGIPLAGQDVRILAAADDGSASFSEAAQARTAPDGQWRAQLPAGPSRLIRVIYDGSKTLLPSTGAATTVVPAGVRLSIAPTTSRWGATIKISGRVLGGYVPASGEVLFVRLRYNGKQIEVAHVRTGRDGQFRTSYTFLGGTGAAVYPFWVTTVPESDYPFAAGSSRRIVVTVRP
jgi:hypothetical protein